MPTGGSLIDGFPRVYARMLGRLTALAEDVEAIVGLARLADPPRPPEQKS